MLDKLIAEGVTVKYPDRAPFQEAAKQVYTEFLTSDAEKELLELIVNS